MSGNRLKGDEKVRSRSVRVHDSLWNAFGDACDDAGTSKSEKLREFMEEFTDTGDDAEREGHVPRLDEHRTIYLAVLDASNESLRLHERHISGLAQQLQSVNKEGVKSVLQDLRRDGYVSLMQHPPDCDTTNLSKTWRIKPRGVDPDEWTYAEHTRGKRPDVIEGYRKNPPESTCISHDFIAARDDCLKCGAPKSENVDTVECDGCGVEALAPDLKDGRCSGCQMTHQVRADGGEDR